MPRRIIPNEEIADRLISSYVDDIVVNGGVLDFEATVFNFAVKIVDEIPKDRQKILFQKNSFETYEDCYLFLLKTYSSLRESLEIFVMNNINNFDNE